MIRTLKRRILPLGGVALLALAGCGGGHHHRPTIRQQIHTQVAHVEQAAGHSCVTGDYAMQCRLATIPPRLQPPANSVHVPRAVSSTVLHGIDFAWTKFSPSSAGDFGASYISNDPSKDWTAGLIRQYHAAGKGTVAVFETTANRAAGGCFTGATDARFSEQTLNGWGYRSAHFDMAVDFDADPGQVADYFRCANQAEPGLVGAYGSALVVNYLCSHGYAHKSWPTYAWLYRTGGVWPSVACGPLRQVLNGNASDQDVALAADYGQFPTPIVGETAAVKNARSHRESAFRQYRAHQCSYPQQDNVCRHIGASIETLQAFLWKTYPRWSLFGRHASHLHSAIAWVVRPEANYWTHAAQASGKAYTLNGCGGIATFGTPRHTPLCNKLDQRARWFGSHATALVKEYSR